VTSTGIDEDQTRNLAEALKIPMEEVSLRSGTASFVDTVNYLAVPTITIHDPEIAAGLRRNTKNHFPEIPIEVKAIDYEALSKLRAPDPDKAVQTTSDALRAAGLTPDHATPIVGHTVFKTVSTHHKKGVPASTNTNLDTHVSYRFTLDGYLLVGPGAQVQVSYGPGEKVTRLIHSSRTLKKGPSVTIISSDAIRSRFSRLLPDNAEVKVRLVYWAPSLRPGLYSSHWSPNTIIPWYAVSITRYVADPRTKVIQPRKSRVHLVPATDDFRFIPSVTLTATTPEESLVEARAVATGGTPPYTYLWGGSNPDASSTRGDFVRYTPLVRDFRSTLRAQSFEKLENVSVTVVDANGISVQAGRSVQVTAHPAPGSHSSVTYGCESPNDPGPSPVDGSYTPYRIAWQQNMGAPGLGGGSERFCWLGDNSWPGDYIEPVPPGSLPASPWIYGDADYSNWGINTTNIMMYNGDGAPSSFAEMYPGAIVDAYNTQGGASVSAPGSTGDVSIGTQSYTVNYVGSWGAPSPNASLQWLVTYACQMLAGENSDLTPWQRWGPAFNGLHSFLGFTTDATDAGGVDLMTDFPVYILGYTPVNPLVGRMLPQTIVQGWINAVNANNMGTPAAMGPIHDIFFGKFFLGISNYSDYYWGKGTVGFNIAQSEINGWWFIQGTSAVQEFP
jgi:hypothetical protein